MGLKKRTFPTIIFVLALPLTSVSVAAQVLDSSNATTDFSGNWKLDRNATTDTRTLSRFDEVTLVISHNDTTLKVVHSGKFKNKVRVDELEYLTSGRGEENPNPLGGLRRKSKTFWSYGNLISEYVTTSVSSTNDEYKQEATDVWELSKDGSTLTIRTEIKEPHFTLETRRLLIRPEKYKKVFRRVA